MSLSQVAPYTQYLNTAWIDFRIQVGPNSYPFDDSVIGTANVIWQMYVAQCVVLPFCMIFSSYLVYVKVIKTKIVPWSFIDGAFVPRGPEMWLIFTTIFSVLQWIHALMILKDALPTYLAKEFFFEIKWTFLYLASTSYIFSLIHATPKTTSSGSKQQESFLPSTIVLNISYVFLSSLGLFPVAFAIVSGVYADLGDDAKATFYVSAHYLSWSLTLVIFTTVLLFFGFQLVSLLRVNWKQMSSPAHSSAGGSSSTSTGAPRASGTDQVTMKRSQNYLFQNWAETYSVKADHYFQASTEEDVIEAIKFAIDNDKTLRVVGTGHSPSDIVCCRDILLNLDPLNRVLHIDKENAIVTAQGGIKMHQLNKVLEENGLAMPNLGSISDQSLAGLISTGTHGTGMNFGIVATIVQSLTIITSTLKRKVLSRDDADPQPFLHALCSLGCLGVIVDVTLKVEKAFNLKFEQRPLLFNEMMEKWEEEVNSAEHTRFWWFPHTEDCIVWKASRVEDKVNPPPKSPLKTLLLGVKAYELSLYASSFVPSLLPTITKRHYDRFFSKEVKGIDKSVEVFNFDCLFKQYVTEWAIDWKDAPKALARLKKFIEETPGIVAHSPVEIRFVKGDNIPLSPAYQRDTCYIGIIMYRPYGKTIPHSHFWNAYESIMKSYKGRPHWAKAHTMTPEDLKAVYPLFEDFQKLRSEWDPSGTFVNEYIRRHFVGYGIDVKAKL
ncbi:hypothetical protein HDV05_006406 [Chytridiales sp. JEL 0842]|nr:hypothetical protein HDV05_006406 [Chytridiales sp. JEL 0842]